jgi:tetratricopeptide (TPR) repeat protein
LDADVLVGFVGYTIFDMIRSIERRVLTQRSRIAKTILVCSLLSNSLASGDAVASRSQSATSVQRRSSDPLVRMAFEHFYNTDYDSAVQEFEAALQAHPNDAFAVNHLFQVVLLREISREDILTGQLYMGDEFLRTNRQSIDPQIQARIEGLANQALSLSETRLKANPNDVEALYSRGVTRSLYAIYQGLVEKAWYPALRSALGAYRDHKRVLELAPENTDAKLVVGVYDYVVASLPMYAKVAAYMFNIHGNKILGIDEVRQAAAGGGDTGVDAKTTLALFLAREQQYSQALIPIRELYRFYPHNFEYGQFEASLLRASGNLAEAVTAYRNLLSFGQQKMFFHPHLERTAVGLGQIYRAQRNFRDAAGAFELAAKMPAIDREESARANLLAGEMYDLLRERDSALRKYKEVLAASNDSMEAQEAKKFLKRPYHEP